MLLGDKVRELRIRRGLTVQQLATATGLSKGFISQIENHHTSPSLATLQDFARALETSAAYLVMNEDPVPCVIRGSERPRLPVGGHTGRVEVLSARPKRNLELLNVELPAGIGAGDQRYVHHGEACLLCVEGRVRLVYSDRVIDLGVDDSCHYDGRVPHVIENDGPATARVLIAITPAACGPMFEDRDGHPKAAAQVVDVLS